MTKKSGKARKADTSAPAPQQEKPAAPPRAPRAAAAPRPATAPPVSRGAVKASSSNFVSVACKLPNGLMLQNYKMVDSMEPVQGGASRMVKVAQKDGAPIRIHGTSRPHGQAPRCPIVMGFAITKGIPADFWERWLKANAVSAIVKNGLIFANPDMDGLRGEAKDNRKQFSGMEPLAQKDDPRAKALANRSKKLKIEQAPESGTGTDLDHDPENVEPDED